MEGRGDRASSGCVCVGSKVDRQRRIAVLGGGRLLGLLALPCEGLKIPSVSKCARFAEDRCWQSRVCHVGSSYLFIQQTLELVRSSSTGDSLGG